MIIDKNSPIPQYYQLQTWLIEQIELGVFKPNDKIPTEEELVKTTSLARATVRQAINNLVNAGYLVRKRKLGTFVINRSANKDKNTIIGVVIPDIRKGFTAEFVRSAGDEAAKTKHSIIICDTDDLYVKADFHADRLIEHDVSGVIFVPIAASNEKNRLIIEKFTRNNIPVVLADRLVPDIDVDYVTTDNFHGAYTITKYLTHRNHRKIAIILSNTITTEVERLEGYKKALFDEGIEIDPSLILAIDGPFVEKHYLQYVRIILSQKDKFTSIFAGHDRIAYLIYTVAQEMGIKIPDDISVVGYDDLPFTNSHPGALTTMRQPVYEMGQMCMKLIMTRIKGETNKTQQIVLKSILIERSSVLPAS